MKEITKLTVPIVGLRWNEHRLGMSTEDFLKNIKVGDQIIFKAEPDGEYLRVVTAYWHHTFAGKVEEYASLLMHILLNKYNKLKGVVAAEPFTYSYLVDVEFHKGDLDGFDDYMEKTQLPNLIIDRNLCLLPPDWENSFQVLYEEIEELMDEIHKNVSGQPDSTKSKLKELAMDRMVELMTEFRDNDYRTLCVEDPVHFIYMSHYISEWGKLPEIANNYKDQIDALKKIVKDIRHERAHSYENGTAGRVYDAMEMYVKTKFYEKGGTLEKFWAQRFPETPDVDELKVLKRELTTWLNKIGKSAYTTIYKKGDRLEWARILQHGKYTRKKLYQILSHLELAIYVEEQIKGMGCSRSEVVEKMKYMFVDGNAEKYLDEIKGKKDTVIVKITNEWIRGGRLFSENAHRDLWKILHDAKIYRASESNWNQQVK